MSDVKHTKGPWRVYYDYGTTQIRTSDDTAIMCDETYYPWVPENIADWHLIAAAPELLEALEDMVDAVEYLMNEGEGNKETANARAAIAKAKGDV